MAKFQITTKNSIPTVISAGFVYAAEILRRKMRSNGQKKLQKAVDESSPKPVKKDLTGSDSHVEFTIFEDNSIDLERCQESLMSDKEIQEWKSFFSTLGGETTQTALTAFAFNGMLKCDVPLKYLCRVNGNPNAMRGMIIKNGKISQQATFSEAGFGNMAPLMVFQCMAAVTS